MKKLIKKVSAMCVAGAMAVVTAVSAFATGGATTTGVAVTSDMLSPLVNAITGNIGVILPVGITIFGIFLGIALVPKLIKMFAHK